jgi:hypothetical protein
MSKKSKTIKIKKESPHVVVQRALRVQEQAKLVVPTLKTVENIIVYF